MMQKTKSCVSLVVLAVSSFSNCMISLSKTRNCSSMQFAAGAALDGKSTPGFCILLRMCRQRDEESRHRCKKHRKSMVSRYHTSDTHAPYKSLTAACLPRNPGACVVSGEQRNVKIVGGGSPTRAQDQHGFATIW